MDEIIENQTKVAEILRLRKGRDMTVAEYLEQTASYVVGNAFDVFSDSEIINRELLKDIGQRRLRVAG